MYVCVHNVKLIIIGNRNFEKISVQWKDICTYIVKEKETCLCLNSLAHAKINIAIIIDHNTWYKNYGEWY